MATTAHLTSLSSLVPEFRARVEKAKEQIAPITFPWYAYDILANIERLDLLLQQAGLKLPDLMAGHPALDIGCADGQLSFFIESLGYQVTAVDYPATNMNGMQAIRALKGALNSSVEIIETDIDQGFTPPAGNAYSLVFLLGILYHLKNPYLILETLARHADYCFLSTRVTRFAADRTTSIHELPVAYLLDPAETNNDATNYWIFSQPGLKRIIKRTGWEICGYLDVGETEHSDPVTTEGDERIFCLLRRGNSFTNGRLLEGWSDPVGPRGGWRWAMESFSVAFNSSRSGPAQIVELEVYLPPEQMQAGTVTITAATAGSQVAQKIFEAPGTHVMRFPLPVAPEDRDYTLVVFQVTPKYPVANHDPRPLGAIVNRIKSVFV